MKLATIIAAPSRMTIQSGTDHTLYTRTPRNASAVASDDDAGDQIEGHAVFPPVRGPRFSKGRIDGLLYTRNPRIANPCPRQVAAGHGPMLAAAVLDIKTSSVSCVGACEPR